MEFDSDLSLTEMNLHIRTTALDNATQCYCAEMEARSWPTKSLLEQAKEFEEYLRGDLFAPWNAAQSA